MTQVFETLDYGLAPESPDLANAWLDSHKRKFGHFIGGGFTKPAKSFATFDPSNDEKLAEISHGTKKDVDAAVKAAREALPKWQALSGFERARYLYAIARLIQKESRLFAVVETMDNGKPIRETRDADVPLAARHFYHHAGWAQHLDREFPGMSAYG
ncbi:MAG: aldehyde dehydrogenase family protein, partial [Hyphomicrobiaceae bacterium]|nr:aldehyde dehydrogenase family protein [Hyphomicrobiaceae bacterium]